ncbi:MAG: DUF3786 domain-containing protein [Syntrophobacterales bacterium]|nr:DUF3786 domain-containing protein [Syntrophobacterales bacterium]
MGSENYGSTIRSYLDKAFSRGTSRLKEAIPAELTDRGLMFKAFGRICYVSEQGIFLDSLEERGAKGVLISIYLSHVPDADMVIPSSWKAFRDIPNTMPYWGAFRSNVEEPLVPFVERIFSLREKLFKYLEGRQVVDMPGDFSFIVFPLPKLPLLYIFYLPDEEFPAEAKCLFSSEYPFMPVDALADVAEHTSRLMIELALKGDEDVRGDRR